ncbi:MAG: shikimate kinase [Candidatus Binataceae bacterium]
MEPKLVLTGFMGTGKSRVGQLAAARLGWPFIDSDAEITARTGKPIHDIFADHGETYFRQLERAVIAELAMRMQPLVIAAGGGALTDEANFRALENAGILVCLSARPKIIAERVAKSSDPRPKLLEGGKPLDERITELLSERAASYGRVSITIDTSDITLEQAAERVITAFSARRERRCEPSA